MACKRSIEHHTLNTHTIGMAHETRAASAKIAISAKTAATRSPYAAGTANAGDSEGDTTPGIRKLSRRMRNVCGMSNGMRASGPRMTLTRGQTNIVVTMPKAGTLIRMLRPNNALLSILLNNEGGLQYSRRGRFVLFQHRYEDVHRSFFHNSPS